MGTGELLWKPIKYGGGGGRRGGEEGRGFNRNGLPSHLQRIATLLLALCYKNRSYMWAKCEMRNPVPYTQLTKTCHTAVDAPYISTLEKFSNEELYSRKTKSQSVVLEIKH